MYIGIFEEVKSQADIIKVAEYYGIVLNRANKAKCCFHNEKTASLSFSPRLQYFNCFGCGKNGDVINFVQLMDNCTPYQALKKINAICGLGITFEVDKKESKLSNMRETAKYLDDIKQKRKQKEECSKYYNETFSNFCEIFHFWRNLRIDTRNFDIESQFLPKIYKNYAFYEKVVDDYLILTEEEIYSAKEYYNKYLGGII